MKIIQSFWTGNKNSLTDNYGWLLPIFNYLSWILVVISYDVIMMMLLW